MKMKAELPPKDRLWCRLHVLPPFPHSLFWRHTDHLFQLMHTVNPSFTWALPPLFPVPTLFCKAGSCSSSRSAEIFPGYLKWNPPITFSLITWVMSLTGFSIICNLPQMLIDLPVLQLDYKLYEDGQHFRLLCHCMSNA